MDDENAGSYAAFPVVSADHVYATGMSLRDWFAGQALMGVIPACSQDTPIPGGSKEGLFALRAYAIADAMLKERGLTATPNTTAKEAGDD